MRTSVLFEALIVGLIGATLGLVVGYGLTWAILAAVRALGVDLGPVAPTLTWQAVTASYAIGILVTLLAASVPARRASRTRPVEALSEAAQSGPEKPGGTAMVGVAMVELGVAAVVCAVWLPVPLPLVWLGIGAALLLIGMVLAAALIGAPLVWLAGRVFRALFGEVGRLAQLNAVRQPRRTAATAATLMIGVALITTVAVLASSTTTSIGDRLSADQRGDFVIAPVGYQPFDADLADRARAVAGVSAVHAFHRGEAQLGDERVSLLGPARGGRRRLRSADRGGIVPGRRRRAPGGRGDRPGHRARYRDRTVDRPDGAEGNGPGSRHRRP
ncbi:FtsX-like permease family protein [Tessaracoccus sp. HDW20]|uniref:FtsX-like permease family protein n=1 Tax=Tessaracoccus coleopterorum TaxID=2714950 RepID=UPI0018D3E059|nr:FtsX-like permease family protein [Tessaracoccus coleopterorum]